MTRTPAFAVHRWAAASKLVFPAPAGPSMTTNDAPAASAASISASASSRPTSRRPGIECPVLIAERSG